MQDQVGRFRFLGIGVTLSHGQVTVAGVAAETLRLAADWRPLREVAREAPAKTGIYALGTPIPLHYPGGCSRFVYVGSSEALSNKLAYHANEAHSKVIGLLKYAFPSGLLASYWLFPKLPTKWLRMDHRYDSIGRQGEGLARVAEDVDRR